MRNISILSGFAAILFTVIGVVASFAVKDPTLAKILLFANSFFLGIGVFTIATTITDHAEDKENEMRGVWERFDEMQRDIDDKVSQIYRDHDAIHRHIEDMVDSCKASNCKHK